MDSENNSNWEYKPDSGQPEAAATSLPADNTANGAAPVPQTNDKSVGWEAVEFIDHPHGPGWYMALIVITLVFAALIFILRQKDFFGAGVVIIVGIIVGAMAKQKPKQVKYELSPSGILVGSKLYKFNNYKSFTVNREGPLCSLNFFPLKKIAPPLSAYFDPSLEDKITAVAGNYLPYEEKPLDTIDRLARRLRL